jgi:hypothetical protein
VATGPTATANTRIPAELVRITAGLPSISSDEMHSCNKVGDRCGRYASFLSTEAVARLFQGQPMAVTVMS